MRINYRIYSLHILKEETMSLNVVDCTRGTYSLPSITYLQAHSNNIVLRMCEPIEEIYDYVLGLLKYGVTVHIRIVKKTICDPNNITCVSDLKNVFEILNAIADREEE